jgi:translation initiation factor eIF-2B subunit epsilon
MCSLFQDLFDAMDTRHQVQVRYDLSDCHIDVCSPEVMITIADNYDFMDLRNDFIKTEVRNTELGYKMFARVVDDKYVEGEPLRKSRIYRM